AVPIRYVRVATTLAPPHALAGCCPVDLLRRALRRALLRLRRLSDRLRALDGQQTLALRRPDRRGVSARVSSVDDAGAGGGRYLCAGARLERLPLSIRASRVGTAHDRGRHAGAAVRRRR